jgi:hypothetical protein
VTENKTITIQLQSPILVGTEEKSEITLTEPKAKDFKLFENFRPGADGNNLAVGSMIEVAMLAAGKLGNITPGEAQDISARDCITIFEKISDFLFQETKT